MSDPNKLFITITHILHTLFEREEAFVKKRVKEILRKNSLDGGSSDGFRHMGLVYTELTGTARTRGRFDRLKPHLVPDMDLTLKDQKSVEDEKARIKQALAMVLKDCVTAQDMRDALPNSLKDLIEPIKGLERRREEAFTLVDNPRAYNQYMELRDKIDFYVAARLLY